MPSQPEKSNSLSANRRDFFRKVLLRGLEQVEQAGKAVGEQWSSMLEHPAGSPSAPATTGRPWAARAVPAGDRYLRPPGVTDEQTFLDTCTACGQCVAACPALCIHITPENAGEKPYIVPRASPCVICDDLSCMKVCPSGALSLVPSRLDIHMGVAVLNTDQCLRTATDSHDRECRVCVNQCPIGSPALAIDDAGRLSVLEGCTGCGVCEWVCPTEPASIAIRPARQDG